MTCVWCREALSALLDGEDRPGERARVDAHLQQCPDCQRYSYRAARVTRLARTEPDAPLPDLIPSVMPSVRPARPLPGNAIPARSGRRWATVLRVVLAMLGIGQLGLATNELFGPQAAQPGQSNLNGAGLTQLTHESSAWNLALAVGFFCVAARPSRTRALLPLVGAFVAGLTVLSVLDVAHGRIVGSRLLSHGLVVLALLVLLALARITSQPREDAPDALDGYDWARRRLGSGSPACDAPSSTQRWRGGDHDLKPSAYRHAA
jgi:predicted anti-sigma-YlaC factor YlaD